MPSSSASRTIERAHPLLGTLVKIMVEGHDDAMAHRAISKAFDEVRRVHALMSFHERDSDVSRINRDAAAAPVRIDARTAEVLRCALQLSERSGGIFDISIGGHLVDVRVLPRPRALRADPSASHRDIALSGEEVRCARRLWMDLGGIAKGYAADRAVGVLRDEGIARASVDAGGDIAMLGEGPRRVALDPGHSARHAVAVVELGEGAVATSSNRMEVREHNQQPAAAHLDGRHRGKFAPQRTVSVLAPSCMHADALTKVVMVLGHESAALLATYGASAYLHDDDAGWQRVGASA